MEKHITTPLTDEKVRELHAGDYVYLSGTVTFMETIGSNSTGEASMKPFLNARMVAILNAISEESTG